MARFRKLPLAQFDAAGEDKGVQYASHQGRRDYHEDRFAIRRLDAPDAGTFLSAAFKKAAEDTEELRSGSTGTALVLDRNLQLTAAFLGDSPVVLFLRDPKTGDITATQITKDHHPSDPAEKQRIKSAGGVVGDADRLLGLSRDSKRLFSLAVSRAFGDDAPKGLSREPEFVSVDLKKEVAAGREVFILVSSDGLYDGLKPADYVAPLKQALERGKEGDLADIFAAFAHQKGSGDNITALVCKVTADSEGGLFLAVADGHGGSAAASRVIRNFKAAQP